MRLSMIFTLALQMILFFKSSWGQSLTLSGGLRNYTVNETIIFSFNVGSLWDTSGGPFPQWKFNDATQCTQFSLTSDFCANTEFKSKLTPRAVMESDGTYKVSLEYEQISEGTLKVVLGRNIGADYSSSINVIITTCSSTEFPNSMLTSSSGCTPYTYNCESTFTCDPGFEGSFTAICQSGATWSQSGTCTPVTTVATPINESFKRGVIAGISICIIYVVFCIVCIISIKVSWMRTIKPHSGIYVLLGITLILLAISAGLSFGLNDDTPNFTTGGIVGLVIGVITILLVIGCCVWICISIINFVPEKTPNGNSPPVGNIPRKNHVPAEEDTNMIPTYENL